MAQISTDIPHRHGPIADIMGILFGTGITATSLIFLTHAELITGQTAGLAVLLSYLSSYSFGVVFFVINLPFYWLGYTRIGLAFTLKTFLSVALMSIFSIYLPQVFEISALHPAAAALIFGMMSSAGLLALFRHGASLGGVGIMALYLQDKIGFRAGYTQLIFDAILFAVAFAVLEPRQVVFSLLGAGLVNLIIAVNHRKDWYVAT